MENQTNIEAEYSQVVAKINDVFHNRGYLYLYFDTDNFNHEYVNQLKLHLLQIVNSLRQKLVISVIFSDKVSD